MKPSKDLLTVFTAELSEETGEPVIRIPRHEVDLGTLTVDESYRVALFKPHSATNGSSHNSETEGAPSDASVSDTPVSVGERLDVEIEDLGDQGDGIAKVEQGYVIFVPGAEMGDRVTVEITKTKKNFAFSEVVSPEPIAG